ncbi:hypothetical protein VPNG_00244 [Cytospora leucostoma]|uniref:N-acetyltransferase domain-containing protein n=1 Tax=Cytospora leucostoma TaxID=1230097 RepID=A0A423XP34_9PEZI|nr:hypothetical protein VPNG_00244 [Cytospora leucostoma]
MSSSTQKSRDGSPYYPRLREASYGELPAIARVLSLAFWDDPLCGQRIHPYREKHPGDVDLYWLRRARVNFWDWRWRWVVAVDRVGDGDGEDGREVIAGIAQWSRFGEGGRRLELGWFDPRNLLRPLFQVAMKIHALLWPNRASDPVDEDVLERAYPFIKQAWSGERAESWYLQNLAVHPAFQGRGIGRMLVRWGLDRAAEDKVYASVIAARGKDPFYRKCGFDVQDGNWGMGGAGNPLQGFEGGNMHWKAPDVAFG